MDPKKYPQHSIQYFWDNPEWLGKRMLFLSGPRQVGKTTLVSTTLCTNKKSYYNWDDRKVRLAFQKNPDFFETTESKWICFDEIHKRPKWKDILKGIYDTHKDQYRFVITGSARLETFKKSGDSLVGRYFHTHLFPLNLGDFTKHDFHFFPQALSLIKKVADLHESTVLEDLLNLSGFPEPFFSGSEGFWKRWAFMHEDLILKEDLRDLSKISELDKVDALLKMLQPAIGQLISYRNLANDLETTHGSIKRWLEMLNKVHLIFSIPPYFKNIRRAYKQEKKWYFMDWKASQNMLFENYIAASLLRMVTLYQDRWGEKMSLHFIRTHDQTEVDFLVCHNNKPWLLIEAKEGTPEVSSALHRFSKELAVPAIVVTRKKNIFKKITPMIYCISWSRLGQLLP